MVRMIGHHKKRKIFLTKKTRNIFTKEKCIRYYRYRKGGTPPPPSSKEDCSILLVHGHVMVNVYAEL